MQCSCIFGSAGAASELCPARGTRPGLALELGDARAGRVGVSMPSAASFPGNGGKMD